MVYYGYDPPMLFYMNILEDRGVNIRFKFMNELQEKDEVVVCQEMVKNYIRQHYCYEERQVAGSVYIYKITGI